MVELLVVPNCPNESRAREALRAAADLAGVGNVTVDVTVIDSDQEAERRGFVGSPTFLIDGIDPFAVPGAPAGLACRVYPSTRGPAGVPDVSALQDALLRA